MRAVPININYRYLEEELSYLFDDADLVAVVYHRELRPRIVATGRIVERQRVLIEVDGDSADDDSVPAEGTHKYPDVVSSGSVLRDFAARSGDDHYILYTGGTTGLPKGVLWRQEDIFFVTLGAGNPGGPPIDTPEQIGEAALANRSHRIGPFLPPGDPGPEEFVSLALGPLMHASGQWSALGTLLGGGKVVLYPHRRMDMARALELVEREHVSMLTMVGDTSARPLLHELEAHRRSYDTSSLRLLGSGGSILSGNVKDRLLAALPSVLAISEAIGSSEAPVQGVAIARKAPEPATSLKFSGRDLTMVVGDDLLPVEPGSGQVGRLATKGRVPIGYYNDPEKTAQTFVEIDGARWALPGDMATVDTDGSIRLLGRGSMCINSGGEKVYPEEVEAVLKAHPQVADAIVVGQKDSRWGERVAALVEPLDSGNPPSLGVLADHCRAQLAGYKVPRALLVVDRAQRSPSG
ncbi:MAG: AMP-binding protein, partial [Acidimicrobiales bacterium]